MTTKEYLEKYNKCPSSENKYEGWKKDLESIRQFNRELIKRYPWLKPWNRWTGEAPDDYDYTYTELDAMPEGWRLTFGDEMVERIHQELVKFNYVNRYWIEQIKEKWGGLRWYDIGYPEDSKIGEIVQEYEELSFKTCICCGKPAEWMSKGWISPYCTACADKSLEHKNDVFKSLWKNEPEKLAVLKKGAIEDNFTKIKEEQN